jgi:hypothetical protein
MELEWEMASPGANIRGRSARLLSVPLVKTM